MVAIGTRFRGEQVFKRACSENSEEQRILRHPPQPMPTWYFAAEPKRSEKSNIADHCRGYLADPNPTTT